MAELTYRRVAPADAPTLLRLATDAHIRRYLLDGELVDEAWVAAEIQRSDQLFDACGVGLWIVHEHDEAIGFVGFRVFEEIEPEPQLLYAFLERVTGRGVATRSARWLLDQVDWDRVVSAVDEPNLASARVLQKVGFCRRGEVAGALGRILLYERRQTRSGPSGRNPIAT